MPYFLTPCGRCLFARSFTGPMYNVHLRSLFYGSVGGTRKQTDIWSPGFRCPAGEAIKCRSAAADCLEKGGPKRKGDGFRYKGDKVCGESAEGRGDGQNEGFAKSWWNKKSGWLVDF